MSKNWNENIETFAKHIQIYKTLALRWQINPSFLHRNLKYVHIARTSIHSNRVPNQNISIEEIFKSRLDDSMNKTSSSLLRGDAFNLHLRGWSYDSSCLTERRGIKHNVSFDLSASCVENCSLHPSNISRTMKLGRIDSVLPHGLSSSMNDDDDESSTISFHVSTKYTYTLTFSSTITASRGDGNKVSMSYGKRVQLNDLFDGRQPLSTKQSLEIQLTPVANNEQEISKTTSSQFPTIFTIYFDLTREAVETLRSGGASTRKRQPISPSKIPTSRSQEQHYQDPNAKRMKTTQKTNRTSNNCNNLSLWRGVHSNHDHNSSTHLPLFYSFVTENKQCLATSYMSSKGHCCLCQFTAINNDLDVLIKHLSYCHPRFTASLKKNSDRPNIELRINAFYDGSLDTFDVFSEYYPRKKRITSELILWRPPRYRRLAMDDAPFVCRRAALTRVYRHTTGAQPIEPEHMQIDSDDEIYPEWTQQLSRRMMEDFQDVNEGEKEMMIMWNHHIMKHNFIADSQMPFACEIFVERHAKDLREKNLIKNFYLHLATLQLYNLIKKTDLAKCIIRLKTILASSPSVSSST
ncbi:unnamed protein product [Rotaria sp. Silwood1]|nr:unnamed protein product [Rotaria sp. Silwood1]CAF3339537.1 unnamed protein product [Rotaria sp. Silwood1]CAF3344034.1 unnamed protein product [Rotaria sp. Silwood1]CAF4767085.1 unnamed protein product [Rotaria sp. Silwood1]CAF4911858.1 unnamed protein product [Rotaria sp. Silwood1]